MHKNLSRVVVWGHQLLQEVLAPGEFAIDLTAGNGYDTLMLAQCVAPDGEVLAFDLQDRALANTRRRLDEHGIEICLPSLPEQKVARGVNLIKASHAELDLWCDRAPRAIIGNLGYLPGGDKELVTRPESTLAALESGCRHLAPGGRIALVVYTGHPGGATEGCAVDSFFATLDENEFEVLRLTVANRAQAPYLLVAGRRG